MNRDYEHLLKWIQSKDVKVAKQNHFWKVRLAAFVMYHTHTHTHEQPYTQIPASKVKHTCAHTVPPQPEGGDIIILLISMMLWRASQIHLALSPPLMSFTNSSRFLFFHIAHLFSNACWAQVMGPAKTQLSDLQVPLTQYYGDYIYI